MVNELILLQKDTCDYAARYPYHVRAGANTRLKNESVESQEGQRSMRDGNSYNIPSDFDPNRWPST